MSFRFTHKAEMKIFSSLCCQDNDAISTSNCQFKNVKCGVMSITGVKPDNPDWINQDSFFIHEDDSSSLKDGRHIFAVFDGHGQYGDKISSFCRENVFDLLGNTEYNVKQTFERLNESLEKSSINVETSGTTCTIAIIHKGVLEVYNVGDSSAFMYRNMTTLGAGFKRIEMSYNHTLEKKGEVERVRQSGGKVFAKSAADENLTTNRKTLADGPVRLWYKCSSTNGTMMGLAMTRSLGDSDAHKVGVLHIPHQSKELITKDDEFIIVASDGIWDMVSPKEAGMVINEYISSLPPVQSRESWDPRETTKILVTRALNKWKGAKHIDDVTCCVIKLKNDYGEPSFIY